MDVGFEYDEHDCERVCAAVAELHGAIALVTHHLGPAYGQEYADALGGLVAAPPEEVADYLARLRELESPSADSAGRSGPAPDGDPRR